MAAPAVLAAPARLGGGGGRAGNGGMGGNAYGGGIFLEAGEVTLASVDYSGSVATAGDGGAAGTQGPGGKGALFANALLPAKGGAAGFGETGLSTAGKNGTAGSNGAPSQRRHSSGAIGFVGDDGPDGASGEDDVDENGAHVENLTLTVTINGQSTIQEFSPFSEDVDVENGQNGNFTSFNGSTTISLTSDPTLGGNVTVNASNGVATFSGLTIDQPGTYFLVATSGGVSSAPFAITVLAPPAAPEVTGLVSVAHTKKGVTSITLGLSEALEPSSATESRALRSATAA